VHKHVRFGRLWAIVGAACLVGALIAAVIPSQGKVKHPFYAVMVALVLATPLFAASALHFLAARKRERLLKESNGKPWLLRKDWAKRTAVASIPAGLVAAWPASAVLVAASALMLLMEAKDDLMRQLVRPLGYFNGAMAIVVLVWGIVLALRLVTHGRPELVIPEIPLIPGRQYDVSARTRARFTGLGSVHARLTCTRVAGVDVPGARATKLHDEKLEIHLSDVRVEDERTVIPIHIHILPDLPGREDDYDPTVKWTLAVTCDAFARALKVSFELPVYEVDGTG